MRSIIWISTAVVCLGLLGPVGPAHAVILIDDLSDGPDPISNFDFDLSTAGLQGPSVTGSDFTGQVDANGGFTGFPGGLWLYPDAVEITFNVPMGDVLSMEITGLSQVGPDGTNITFFVDTTSGLQTASFSFGSGAFTVSSNRIILPGGGRVLSVRSARIQSFEARFDTITYDLVPEPGSLALLALGGLTLLRRRRD